MSPAPRAPLDSITTEASAAQNALKRARRRTVATRVLLSYAVVSAAFAVVAGWAVLALRGAAEEVELIRTGYLPVSLALRTAESNQDKWNSQLNHITTARNPADKRVWFETALRVGRPKSFGEVRAALNRAFVSSDDAAVRDVGLELSQEASAIEQFLKPDRAELGEMFDALAKGDAVRADRLNDALVTRGAEGRKRLAELEQRVERQVDLLLDRARQRERFALRLLLALAAFTLLVGFGAALYARRVLRPLGAVTERAKAVARGDLTPREVVAPPDEIGELATTFESMVRAIGQANAQLVASERLATIGKMAARVTHEIRNPLSSIALNVELLEEELESADEEQRALLKAIQGEVERLTALSEQYLSVARRQEPRLADEDVGEIVAEACSFVRREVERDGFTLELRVAEDLPAAQLDESQLKQALMNLLRNAREAMTDGEQQSGRIVVGVELDDSDDVVISIEDDGPGIDAETKARLFEPFFTTKTRGTGLGLAITRQIVEAHGGRIECEDAAGGGTRFSLTFPVAGPSSGMPPAPPALLDDRV